MSPLVAMSYAARSTEELVVAAQASDMQALEALIQRYQRNIYVTLSQLAPERDDIADLTQDVLLRMCRSIKSVRNPKTFKYWLNRIITNLFYDTLRKQPRQLKTISMDASAYRHDDDGDGGLAGRDIPDTSEQPEGNILNAELDETIRRAISQLPEQFRVIIVLREIQGLSYEEIATLTHSNLGTVKSRLARARLRLQEMIGPYIKAPD